MAELDPQGLALIIGSIAAAFATIAGLFFKQMNTQEKRNAETFKELSQAMRDNTKSNQLIATATTKSANEAEKRNGHLAELRLQSQEAFKTIGDRNYEATQEVMDCIKGNK